MTTDVDLTATEHADDGGRVGELLGKAVGDIGIPPCPAILEQINREMGKDEPNLKYLDALICSDVGLAAGLISLANSPFFGFRNRVRSAHEALQMFGLRVASAAIAGMVLRKLFPTTPTFQRFWDASARIARLSGWLAQEGRVMVRLRPDAAYTFGLFRDCGIPLLMMRSASYADVLKQANEDGERGFTTIEHSACQTSHAAIGCLLSQAWWLPDEISMAIRHHHDYALLSGGGAMALATTTVHLIATTQLAEHLLQHHTGLSQTREWQKAGEVCLALLGVDEERLKALQEESARVAQGA